MVDLSRASHPADSDGRHRLRRWQFGTAGILTAGYGAFYLCRMNLSVAGAMPGFTPGVISEYEFGLLGTVGTLVYAFGKLLNGLTADFLGGRRLFLIGLFGAAGLTVGATLDPRIGVALVTLAVILFGAYVGGALLVVGLAVACGFAIWFWPGSIFLSLLAFWMATRYVQSGGWPALVKVSSHWFDYHWHGSVMGVISLSYLVGDFLAKAYLGFFADDSDWRTIYYLAAGATVLFALMPLLLLREKPVDLGLPEPLANPENLYGPEGNVDRPAGFFDILGPFLRSLAFWMVLLMSFGLTFIRETLNYWLPHLLREVSGSPGRAILGAAVFPFGGAISVLAAGYLSDVVAGGNRARIILPGLVLATLSMMGLAFFGERQSYWVVVALVGLSAVFLIGPYSFLAGVIALDLGGKHGSSTASGIIDSVGYAGGSVAGIGIAALLGVGENGQQLVFQALFGAALVSALAAGVYLWRMGGLRRESA